MAVHALIDGDIVAYRCAAVCEKENAALAVWQASQLVDRILEDSEATTFKIYLSGDVNFRKEIYPEYKVHRESKPKPVFLEDVREDLVRTWNASICDGIEADDALGIEQTQQKDTIICSIDKDLLQIPGRHFNFVKRNLTEVDEYTGWYNFYIQLLVGDSADNVPGCPGIGQVKAPKVLEGAKDHVEMYERVVQAYMKAEVPFQNLVRNASLLYIWRKNPDTWLPPTR